MSTVEVIINPGRRTFMVRRLLAHVQCQLALRQWEEKLEVAVRLFWLGDFAAADELYSQLLRRIIPFTAILEAPPSTPSASRRDPITERLFDLATQISVGRWAISYVQGDHAPLPHPALPTHSPGTERAQRFIVDVHLARADLSPQALQVYADHVDSDEDPQRFARINTLMQSASPSPAAARVLRKLYARSTDYVDSARRLCVWLINEGRLSSARALAEQLFRHHPTDAVCADLLAYTAETNQDWRIACAAYSRAGNPLRSAFMAMLAEDPLLLDAAVQELPDKDLHTPLGYLCEGRLSYQRGKLRQALDAWILAVSPGTDQEQDIPLLAALRSFEEDPATALLEIRTLAGNRLPAAALVALEWIAGQMQPRPRRRKSAKSVEPSTADARLRDLLLTQSPDAVRDPGYPFVKAVAGSAAFSFIGDATAAERPLLLRWLDPPLREQIEAIDFAGEARWFEALAILGDGDMTPLRRRLAGKALAESLQRRDWLATHQLLDDWRPILQTVVSTPNLEERMHIELWEKGDYLLLAQDLLRVLLAEGVSPAVPSDLDEAALRVHHNAAIVDGQMALPARSVDGWRAAIAHWAVVLAHGSYWQSWYDERRARYGAGADTLDADHLPERVAQQVAEYWQHGLSQEARLRCLALLSWEWQSVLAMRHLFRVAHEAGAELPPSALRLVAPTLIQQFAPDTIPTILAALIDLEVSADARSLLAAAFSVDAEVEALINAGHFDLALQVGHARGLSAERLRPLQMLAQQQMIAELLDRGDADGALHVAVSAYQEFED
ncbi:MAG: hypothetical protein KDD84_16490, partial [Caldilineaceae bacterium]|nr:hypothetical protein [Caldilineaceae bacterium]